jgi:predicted phage tail protein
MTKIIKGAGGGGKGGDGEGRTPVESPDSLRSIQYANVIDLLSEGEIEGLVDGSRSIFFDDTPLQNADGSFNFTGVTVQTRNGTQSQSYIPGFSAAEAENAVGIEVTQALPVVRYNRLKRRSGDRYSNRWWRLGGAAIKKNIPGCTIGNQLKWRGFNS